MSIYDKTMDKGRHYDELAGFPAELGKRMKQESEFAVTNNFDNPSRYGRNVLSEEKNRHPEQPQTISRRSRSGEHFRFPESGVNSDTRGLHGSPDTITNRI